MYMIASVYVYTKTSESAHPKLRSLQPPPGCQRRVYVVEIMSSPKRHAECSLAVSFLSHGGYDEI
jgi:hypothetical protein